MTSSGFTLSDEMVDTSFISTADHERLGYLRCRTIGHAWHDYDSNWTPQYGTPLTLRCERCGMERREAIGSHGVLLNRHYTRPPGYGYPPGTRPTRADFRVMLLAQRITEATETRTKKRSKAS